MEPSARCSHNQTQVRLPKAKTFLINLLTDRSCQTMGRQRGQPQNVLALHKGEMLAVDPVEASWSLGS